MLDVLKYQQIKKNKKSWKIIGCFIQNIYECTNYKISNKVIDVVS